MEIRGRGVVVLDVELVEDWLDDGVVAAATLTDLGLVSFTALLGNFCR